MYLWIDLWDKRCWIAIEVEGIVIPKDIVLRPKLISRLKKLVVEYSITTIVVGLPYDLYGKRLKQLDKTNNFIKKLKDIFPHVHIDWIDERFTTFEAENIWKSLWLQEKNDSISALLILESYIKHINN
jgi:putative holliday junction resolvase